MPGLTIASDPAGRVQEQARVVDALAAGLHLADYRSEILWRSPRLLVAATRYPAYPIVQVAAVGWRAILEGRIYSLAEHAVAPALRALAAAVRASDDDGRAALAHWLGAVDGDFVLVLLDERGERALVVGDRYGRLPLYAGAAGGGARLVSRELPVVRRALDDRTLRPLGIAEYLAFGYPLGSGTVFAAVERVAPATRLVLPDGVATTLRVHDFEAKGDLPVGPTALPALLAERLVDAVRARLRSASTPVVSLSGGLDSRTVLAALRRAGAAPTAVTHLDAHGWASRDAHVAREAARRLGVPWRLFPLSAPTGDDVARLLALKCGANYLGMSRVLPYLDGVRDALGSQLTFFTGDQGDRILGDVGPVRPLADDAAIVDYVLRKETILPPDAVAAATGVPVARLRDAVAARLATYPERSATQRWVHFLFAERAVKWLFEGEDRNRAWFWHVTPFYAPGVFELAMRVPDADKADHRLRYAVLAALAPEIHDLPNASIGDAPGTIGFVVRRRLERLGKAALLRLGGPELERVVRRVLKPPRGYAADSMVVRTVARQLLACPAIAEVLDPNGVRRLLAEAPACRGEQFSVVLTITSLIETMAGERGTLAGLATTAVL